MTDPEMPPPVEDRYRYWREQPSEPSPRLWWWLNYLAENRLSQAELLALLSDGNNYDDNAAKFGVWLWEWHHVLYHVMRNLIDERGRRIEAERWGWTDD